MGIFQSVPADDPRVVDRVRDYATKNRGEEQYDTSKVPAWSDTDVDAFVASSAGRQHAATIDRMRGAGQTSAGAAAALGGAGTLFVLARTKNIALGLVGGVLGAATGFLGASTFSNVQHPGDKEAVKAVRQEFLQWHIARSKK